MTIARSARDFMRPFLHYGRRVLTGKRRGFLSHAEIVALLGKPDPVILEIGCNDGTDTAAFLENFADARIICFEPDQRALQRFRNRLQGAMSRVELHELAISDREGWIDFHHCHGAFNQTVEDWDSSGSIRAPKHHLDAYPEVKFGPVTKVRTATLDAVCADLGVDHVDFLWMDVQGAEADVFRGAARTLEKVDYIYTEYSNDELYEGQAGLKDLLRLTPDFEVMTLYPADVLLRRKR